MAYHLPVMAAAAAECLVGDAGGVYLDATAGGGGHSLAIMERLSPSGRLIALDRDAEAVAATRARLQAYADRTWVVRTAFAQMDEVCARLGICHLHGILFDLGVSSHQLDAPDRGFSFRSDGPLDMRMDGGQGASAATWLAHTDESRLEEVIRRFGEERAARNIARAILRRRDQGGLRSTRDLREAVLATHPRMVNKTLARVFQAIRIAVNDELGQLETALDTAAGLLAAGGRLVVIAYHSLEDRRVKQKLASLMRGCVCPPRIPMCVCGHTPSFRKFLRRPLKAGDHELQVNPRARSAIMRAFEKL